MRPDEIRKHLDAEPFIPFRLCLSDRSSYEIQHPDQAIVTTWSGQATERDDAKNSSIITQQPLVNAGVPVYCALHYFGFSPNEPDNFWIRAVPNVRRMSRDCRAP